MTAWWEAMTMIEQIFAVVGIAATVLLVIEVILLLIGVGHGADADMGADAPGDIDPGGHAGDFGGGHADFGAGGMPHTDIHIGDVTADGLSDVDITTDMDMDATADAGGHMDTHPHFDGSGLHLFTLQGLVAFFAVFGWSGLLMLKSDGQPAPSVIFAIVFGFLAMLLMAVIMRAMLRLQSDGTLDIRNALGKSGSVYLPIHPHRSQPGKITLIVQDRLVEMDAVTDEDETIATGAQVVVVAITSGNTLVVRSK